MSEKVKIYESIWRNKFLTIDATTLDEMIAGLQGAVYELTAMRDAGIVLETNSDDYAFLTTTDAELAKKFGFEEKEDFDEEDEDFEDIDFDDIVYGDDEEEEDEDELKV